MGRYAFRLRIKSDRIQEYEQAHKRVWPELLSVIERAGISDYSIFRYGVDLFFYMRADDFDLSWEEIEKSEINTLWQAEMAPLFDEPLPAAPGERFPMMREVFYLSGG
jgi:L-rhamnose mutarotase